MSVTLFNLRHDGHSMFSFEWICEPCTWQQAGFVPPASPKLDARQPCGIVVPSQLPQAINSSFSPNPSRRADAGGVLRRPHPGRGDGCAYRSPHFLRRAHAREPRPPGGRAVPLGPVPEVHLHGRQGTHGGGPARHRGPDGRLRAPDHRHTRHARGEGALRPVRSTAAL